MMEEEIIKELFNAVTEGDEEKCKAVAEEAIKREIDPIHAIEHGLAVGINEMGRRLEHRQIFLPELLLAADAMKVGMDILLRKIPKEKHP